jgi:hypothetical protein
MTILYSATSLSDAHYYRSNVAISSTNASNTSFFPANCKEGIYITQHNDSGGAYRPDFYIKFPQTLQSGWVSFYFHMIDKGTNNWHHWLFSLLDINNLSGYPVFGAYCAINSFNIYAGYPVGSDTVSTSSSILFDRMGIKRFDIYFNINSTTGSYLIYVDGYLIFSLTNANTTYTRSGFTGINCLAFQNEDSNYGKTISNIIIADEDTRNMELTIDYPIANGTLTNNSCNYEYIKETGTSNKYYIFMNETSNTATFIFPTLANTLSSAIPVSLAAKVVGNTSIYNAYTEFVSANGTSYTDTNLLKSANSDFSLSYVAMNVNPFSNTSWTIDDINNTELGIKLEL